MSLNYDHCRITTDQGFVLVVPQLVATLGAEAFTVQVYRHQEPEPECITWAVARTEEEAAVVAEALAHHFICPDCQEAVEH